MHYVNECMRILLPIYLLGRYSMCVACLVTDATGDQMFAHLTDNQFDGSLCLLSWIWSVNTPLSPRHTAATTETKTHTRL